MPSFDNRPNDSAICQPAREGYGFSAECPVSYSFERRQALRTSTDIPGLVRFPNGTLSTCWITDVSEAGARLFFEVPGLMPERFVLMIGARPPCNVRRAWRSGQEVGVEFEEVHAEMEAETA